MRLINRFPTTSVVRSDGAAHRFGDAGNLLEQLCVSFDGELLGSVAESPLRVRMNLDDEPVRARRYSWASSVVT